MSLHGRIPPEYKIPKYHGPSSWREFDDNALFLLNPDSKGTLTVEGKDGEFKVKSQQDILKLFQHKYNWTYSRLGEMECLFQFFKRDQLFKLKMLHELEFGDYKIYWIIGTDKIRLTQGNNTRTSKYLINVAPRLYKDYTISELDTLRMVVDKLIWLNQYIPLNLSSPASTTKDLILAVGKKEFTFFNKIPLDITKFLHSCYIGPRMESRCLGTIDNIDNRDQIKAYLRAFGRCPSLAPGHILKVMKGTKFNKDAHPGSGYEIKVKVPESYSQFPPIPFKWGGHIPYPHGEFITKVSKPYIDLLNELGDIPYEILDSIQVIMLGKPVYPFAELAYWIEQFENIYQNSLYPINLKTLHYPIIGHMLHIHRNIDLKDGEMWYESSQDYNPINACAIQGMVAVELWKFSQKHETEAIRVDALSGYNLPKEKGYKEELSGLMTFLTPGLKDKPGSTMYRDLIERDRDLPGIKVNFPLRLGINRSWHHPHKIGEVINYSAEIPPLGGGRKGKRVEKVGELLEGRLPLAIVNVQEDEEPQERRYINWIDDYLRWYPQSQI